MAHVHPGAISKRAALVCLLGLLFVDEEGTEAAAATAVIAKAPGPRPPQPVEFRADRPFLFLVRDARHDTILFLGRFTGP